VSDKHAGVVTMAIAPTPSVSTDAAIVEPGPPPPPPPEPPKLECVDGTSAQPAKHPEPTWFCTRADGVKYGAFFTLFPDLSIAISGSYKDGKLDGAWKRNHPGGALAEHGAYVAGQRTGTWRQHAPDGSLLGEYKLTGGTGKAKRWYDDGPLYSETTLRKGVPHGPMTVRNREGSVVISAKLHNGKLDGKHVVGSKNALRIEETFSRGVRVGPRQIWQFWALLIDETYDGRGKLDGGFTIWRDKKIPRVQGTYDHGKRVGTWIWTDRQNSREREGDFVAGKKSGTWNEYLETKLTFSGNYTDGKPDGEFIYYDRTGAELGRFTIKGGNGTMVTFHGNRKPASKTRISGGLMNGKYEELTMRGKQLVEGSYAADRKHGTWREWNDSGVLQSEIHWRRGKLDGALKKYVDGKIALEAVYKDGKAEGPYTEYRDGKPSLVGQFMADRRAGTWTMTGPDATVVLTATYKDGLLDGPWREVVAGTVVEGTLVAGRRSGAWTP
jgi:antitoxin component YwqK of YwqJK toxin-antitoxin module